MAKDPRPRVAQEFAQAVIDRDFARAYQHTTAGLQQRMSLEEFTRALKQAEADVVPPTRFYLSTNPLNQKGLWESIQRDGKKVPADIDPRSFRQWLVIKFEPDADNDDDLDACYDFWMMLVHEKGEDKIAYFDIQDPD